MPSSQQPNLLSAQVMTDTIFGLHPSPFGPEAAVSLSSQHPNSESKQGLNVVGVDHSETLLEVHSVSVAVTKKYNKNNN